MSQLTFYWHIVSQPGRAVKAVLDIYQIPHKAVHLDIFRLQHKKPHYMKINPMGKIPFLTSGSIELSESSAMLIYLWEKYPQIERSLYGQTEEERAKVNQYLSWCQNIFRPAMVDLIFLKRDYGLRQKKPTPQILIKHFETKLHEGINMLEKLLQGKDYLANNKLTFADIMLFFQVTTFTFYGIDQSKYPNIDRWFKKIYAINEVKQITHKWFPVAQQFSKIIQSLPVEKASL